MSVLDVLFMGEGLVLADEGTTWAVQQVKMQNFMNEYIYLYRWCALIRRGMHRWKTVVLGRYNVITCGMENSHLS